MLINPSTRALLRELLIVHKLLQTELFWINALPIAGWYNQLALFLRPQTIGLQALEVINVVQEGCSSSLTGSCNCSARLSTSNVGRGWSLSLSLCTRIHLRVGCKVWIAVQTLLLTSPFLGGSVPKVSCHRVNALRLDILQLFCRHILKVLLDFSSIFRGCCCRQLLGESVNGIIVFLRHLMLHSLRIRS